MPDQRGDRHKNPPFYVRPEASDREWFLARAERTGRRLHAILREALSDYRAKHDPDSKPEEGEQR
jgi:hypothetical protein